MKRSFIVDYIMQFCRFDKLSLTEFFWLLCIFWVFSRSYSKCSSQIKRNCIYLTNSAVFKPPSWDNNIFPCQCGQNGIILIAALVKIIQINIVRYSQTVNPIRQGYSNFSSQGPYIFLARTQGPHNFFDDHATMK